jgi:hypothetical protein
MSEEDFAYGVALADACTHLQHSRTARLLGHERGVTFADLADEWIAWHPQQHAADADADTMRRFIAHVCEQNAIPPQFYDRSATHESAATKDVVRMTKP